MIGAIYAFVVSFLLVAGSTQIQHPVLSVTQFVFGVWFAIVGAIAGWQSSRR
jgi:hypothetical protein